ncbi:MAG: hypothetical protein LBR44_01925, partial [Clostridiales Family XIII bacterium]|nr:hypothetical protein [Clostridiales Family XIII bacterium]
MAGIIKYDHGFPGATRQRHGSRLPDSEKMHRKRLLVSLLIVMLLATGGCGTGEYVYHDGLKLPTQTQRDIFNEPEPENFMYHNGELVEIQSPPGAIYYTVIPHNYDRDVAQAKGMYEDGQFNDKFFYIQTLCRKGLEAMLVAELDLKKYDQQITESTTSILPLASAGVEMMESWLYYYESFSMMNLDYIFLRNNIYVERLEGADLSAFERAYGAQETEVSTELQETIDRTWKSIINVDKNGDSKDANYHGNAIPPELYIPSDSLVLKLNHLRNTE